MAQDGYARELRRTADEFTMTVAVIAEREGRDARELAIEALNDAAARLNETGVLGEEPTNS